MTKKVNWVAVDKRIRDRRPTWSKEEREALDAGLAKLPDMQENAEVLTIRQPAVGDGAEEEEVAAAETTEAAAEAPADAPVQAAPEVVSDSANVPTV